MLGLVIIGEMPCRIPGRTGDTFHPPRPEVQPIEAQSNGERAGTSPKMCLSAVAKRTKVLRDAETQGI